MLNLSHTRKMTRDTSKYIPFRQMVGVKKTPSLKLLAKHILGIDIQQGEHDSVRSFLFLFFELTLIRFVKDDDWKIESRIRYITSSLFQLLFIFYNILSRFRT